MSVPPPMLPLCPRCQWPNEDQAAQCPRCGESLGATIPSNGADGAANALVEALFPVKNMPALIAFWVCLFALIPGVGIIVAVVTVVLGARGLRNVRKDPAVGGRWQAQLSIAVAALCGLINLAVVGIAVYEMMQG